MKKLFLISLTVLLFGASCARVETAQFFDIDKIKQTLNIVAVKEEWLGEVIEHLPSEENNYGKSYIVYGPYKEGAVSDNSSFAAIEFQSSAYRDNYYNNDVCFKGSGVPQKIEGVDVCCLNDTVNATSKTIMKRENFVFIAKDIFHANCASSNIMKDFWTAYKEL